MNSKLLFFILYLFIIWITIQTNELFNTRADIDLMNEMESLIREARSFGCNGPNDRNVYRCKLHCRNRNYKGGRCSKSSNYTRCVCYKSPDSKP